MWIKEQYLKVVCANNNGDELILDYRLFDNSLVHRWKNLVDQSNLEQKKLSVTYSKQLNQQEINDLFLKFIEDIKVINLHYDKLLPTPDSVDQLMSDQNLLNELHSEYEFYGDRCRLLEAEDYYKDPTRNEHYAEPWPGLTKNKVLHEKMLRLNDQIHQWELLARTQRQYVDKTCYALIDWLPAGLHENLLPQDYILFNAETFWGYLYLGYNTLGKNWISIATDNDLDVVKRNAVRPQKRFAAEFILEFKQKGQLYATQNMFYNWILNNNLLTTAEDLSMTNIAFGSAPLGKLAFYRINKFTSVSNDNLQSYEWQSNFNTNIWSKFNTVISAGIYNKPGKIEIL